MGPRPSTMPSTCAAWHLSKGPARSRPPPISTMLAAIDAGEHPRGHEAIGGVLKQIGLPLSVYLSAEVAVRPGRMRPGRRGELLGVAGRTSYILVEIPMDKYVDIQDTVTRFSCCGVCPILAHPERYPGSPHKPGEIDALIALGALVQVTASVQLAAQHALCGGHPRMGRARRGATREASDGHSPDRRPPEMASAYQQIAAWLGREAAGRLCSLNGLAVLEGRPLRLPPPALTPRAGSGS